MRTISVRNWMVVGFLIFVLSAAIFYHVADLLGHHFAPPSPAQAQRQAAALDSAQTSIIAGAASWSNPQWQQATAADLQQLGTGAVVRSPGGQEIFRAGPYTWGGPPSREIAVVSDGRPAAVIDLYQAPSRGYIAVIGAIAALVVAFLFVRFQMSRYVVQPLEAMERAARRIAGGDLEFELPPSRVTEVAQVGTAFRAMGDGLRASLHRQAELEEQRRF